MPDGIYAEEGEYKGYPTITIYTGKEYQGKWDDTFANFDAMDKEGFAHFLGNASDDGIEVIGNIYENPELLK